MPMAGNKMNWLTLVAIFLIPIATVFAGDPLPAAKLNPVVGWSGAQSQFPKKQVLRISTDRDWIETWLKHTGQPRDAENFDRWHNHGGVPAIDFSRYMVIAIFEGKTVNCAGFAKEHILDRDDEMVLRFEFKSYSTIGGPDQVTPFGIYVVPKSDKTIHFQFPEPGPKDAPSGNWETYSRLEGKTFRR